MVAPTPAKFQEKSMCVVFSQFVSILVLCPGSQGLPRPQDQQGQLSGVQFASTSKDKSAWDQVNFFFQKITWFSTWSGFTVEDTWCPPLPETSTPTQTRFSTFLLIMRGILKSAVCLWWCKMLRSHYNKARGDYFLISIITQSVIISRTNLISKRVVRSLMMIFLMWCVGLKSFVW